MGFAFTIGQSNRQHLHFGWHSCPINWFSTTFFGLNRKRYMNIPNFYIFWNWKFLKIQTFIFWQLESPFVASFSFIWTPFKYDLKELDFLFTAVHILGGNCVIKENTASGYTVFYLLVKFFYWSKLLKSYTPVSVPFWRHYIENRQIQYYHWKSERFVYDNLDTKQNLNYEWSGD